MNNTSKWKKKEKEKQKSIFRVLLSYPLPNAIIILHRIRVPSPCLNAGKQLGFRFPARMEKQDVLMD